MDVLRHIALTLRDLTETVGDVEFSACFADGTTLVYSADDGCHLLTTEGGTLDLTEWADGAGMLPVEGVESVREQMVLRAATAGADRCS